MPGPVFLRGDSVTLHPIGPDDAPFLARVVNHPDVRAGIAQTEPTSVTDEREWIERIGDHTPDGFRLLVCAEEEPVGTIGSLEAAPHWGTVQIGYAFAPDHWNHGYATDAVRQVVAYAADELRYEKITARVFETNPASARVLEKSGFDEEGILRRHVTVDGERVDLRLFAYHAGEQ